MKVNFCASADWMGVIYSLRIETCFPIEDKNFVNKFWKRGLNNYLQDNRRAWELQADGTWIQCQAGNGQAVHIAQQQLMNQII